MEALLQCLLPEVHEVRRLDGPGQDVAALFLEERDLSREVFGARVVLAGDDRSRIPTVVRMTGAPVFSSSQALPSALFMARNATFLLFGICEKEAHRHSIICSVPRS